MGETRTKKPSKRALKANQKTECTPDVTELSRDTLVQTTDICNEAPSNTHLTPPTLSSKTSHTSLLTSGSAQSWQGSHNSESYDSSRVEVRLTSNKGYALFATSTIQKGSIVLAEVPVIRLTALDECRKSQAEEILQEKFDHLPKAFQRDFKKLHDTRKDGFSRIRSIYHSNCYNLDGSRSVHGGSCIGLKASRINHSCIPNVQFFFEEAVPESLLEECKSRDGDASHDGDHDARTGIMIFRALRRIARGKEIVSNYESIYATRTHRQFQLQIHYGFRCDCDACVGAEQSLQRDDDRRLTMMMLRNKVNAVEKRLVELKSGSAKTSKAESFYLRQRKATEDIRHKVDDLVPLTIDHCQEMLESLERLELLLDKAGLLGIERDRVRQEHEVWTKRATYVSEQSGNQLLGSG